MGSKDGLTWLTRLAIRDEGGLQKLEWALRIGGQEIVEHALEVARETGYPAAHALAKLARERDDAILDTRIWKLAHDGSNVLAPLLAEIGLRRLSRAMESALGPEEIHELRIRCINNLMMCGRPKDALPFAETEVEWQRARALACPDDRPTHITLAAALLRLESLYVSDNRWSEAKLALHEALAIAQRLHQGDPENSIFQFEYFNCLSKMATRLAQTSDPEANNYFTEALVHGRALHSAYPDRYRNIFAGILVYHANRIVDERPTEAASLAREAVEIYAERSEADPDSWNHRLASTLRDAAVVLFKSGAARDALDSLHKADQIFRTLRAAEEDSYRDDHANTLEIKGQILGRLGKLDDQIAAITEALAILDASQRFSFGSAKLAGQLALLLSEQGDASPKAPARLALWHTLHCANTSDHPNRAVLLACVPHLAALADPTETTSLQHLAQKLAEEMALLEILAEPETNADSALEFRLANTTSQGNPRIDSLISGCLEELYVLCGKDVED